MWNETILTVCWHFSSWKLALGCKIRCKLPKYTQQPRKIARLPYQLAFSQLRAYSWFVCQRSRKSGFRICKIQIFYSSGCYDLSLENFQCNQLVLSRDTGDTDRLEELNFPNPKVKKSNKHFSKEIHFSVYFTLYKVFCCYCLTAFEKKIFSPD